MDEVGLVLCNTSSADEPIAEAIYFMVVNLWVMDVHTHKNQLVLCEGSENKYRPVWSVLQNKYGQTHADEKMVRIIQALDNMLNSKAKEWPSQMMMLKLAA